MIKLRDTVISNVPPDKYHVWVKPNNGKYEMYIFSTSKGVWVRISGSGSGSGTGGDTAELEAQIQRIQRELDEANAKYELLEGKIVADAVTVTYQQAQSGITVGGDGKYYSKIVIEPNPSSMTKPKFTAQTFPETKTFLTGSNNNVLTSCLVNVGSSSWQDVQIVLKHGNATETFDYTGTGPYTFSADVTSAETWQWSITYKYSGVAQTAIAGTKCDFKFGLPKYYGFIDIDDIPETITFDAIKDYLTASAYDNTMAIGPHTFDGGDNEFGKMFYLIPSEYNCNVNYIWTYDLGWESTHRFTKTCTLMLYGREYDVFQGPSWLKTSSFKYQVSTTKPK